MTNNAVISTVREKSLLPGTIGLPRIIEKLLSIFLLLFLFTVEPSSGQTIQRFVVPDQSVRDVLKGRLNRPRADTYYLVALNFANKGDLVRAEEQLRIGLSIEPGNVKLLNLRGALWARDGKINDAVKMFRAVLRVDPDNAYARASLKWLDVPKPPPPPKIDPKLIKEVTPTAPVPVKETPEEKKPETPKYTKSFFTQIQEKQRCFYVMTAIKRAQEEYETSHADKKGNLDLDALVSEKLLTSSPVCGKGGTFSWKDGAPECSKHGSFSLLEPEVKSVFADFNEGMRAKFLRNYPDAVAGFSRVTTLYPNWAEAFYQLGDTNFRLGKDKEAIQAIRKCLAIDGSNLDGQLLLANLFFKTGQKDAALKLLEKVEKSSPNSVYSLSARSLAGSIKSGKNYYSIFPPE